MLDSLLAWLDAMGASTNHPGVLAVLAGASCVEYVFPPFPGDTVTLLGAVLVGAYAWNLPLVFAALMMGSLVGGLIAFWVGKRWGQRRLEENKSGGRLDALVLRFEHHGSWYLLLNRFLPGIRPLFFVAAGLCGMSTRRMLLLSAISAALWNALLLAAGAAVGHNLERLESLRHWYGLGIGICLLLLVLVGVGTWARRRRS